jgi:hypothetical protein
MNSEPHAPTNGTMSRSAKGFGNRSAPCWLVVLHAQAYMWQRKRLSLIRTRSFHEKPVINVAKKRKANDTACGDSGTGQPPVAALGRARRVVNHMSAAVRCAFFSSSCLLVNGRFSERNRQVLFQIFCISPCRL